MTVRFSLRIPAGCPDSARMTAPDPFQPVVSSTKPVDSEALELYSTITCPDCGHSKRELMPTDACQFFYECEGCGTLLKPKQGDCCVYCSYGDIKCPPIQEGDSCCSKQ